MVPFDNLIKGFYRISYSLFITYRFHLRKTPIEDVPARHEAIVQVLQRAMQQDSHLKGQANLANFHGTMRRMGTQPGKHTNTNCDFHWYVGLPEG